MAGTPPSPSGSGDALISQADIDALMQGVAAPAVSAQSTPDDISQADIDALMKAAGGGSPDAAITPSAAIDTRLDTLGRPFDAAAGEMQAAIEEERAAKAAQPASQKFSFPEISAPPTKGVDPKKISMLNDVKLRVKVELGRTRMLVEDVLELGEGSVVELDKLAGDPVDVYANERLVARGEVLVLNDTFCVRVSEIVSNDPHRVSV
jgi:flagellar motor switch protein FliN/FliY